MLRLTVIHSLICARCMASHCTGQAKLCQAVGQYKTTTIHLLAGELQKADFEKLYHSAWWSMSTHAMWRWGTELKSRLCHLRPELPRLIPPRRCKKCTVPMYSIVHSGAMQRKRSDSRPSRPAAGLGCQPKWSVTTKMLLLLMARLLQQADVLRATCEQEPGRCADVNSAVGCLCRHPGVL